MTLEARLAAPGPLQTVANAEGEPAEAVDLEPGDILATGTNHRGLSAFQNGDTVDLEVQGMGKLTVKVRDDLNRTWARETRLDREEKGLKGYTPQLTGKYAGTHSGSSGG